jgi:hypothetical protein
MQDMTNLNGGITREELCWLRLRLLHEDRCEVLRKDEQHVRLCDESRLVIHLLPEACWLERQEVSAAKLKHASESIKPLGGNSSNYGTGRFNADGYLLQSGDTARCYTQLYRCGKFEAVMSDLYYEENGDGKLLRSWCEEAIISTLEGYLPFAKLIGLEPPFWFLTSVLGCAGVRIPINRAWGNISNHSIDRDVVRLPATKISAFDTNPGQHLRPVIDVLWNAAGLERSPNYDENGNRKLVK